MGSLPRAVQLLEKTWTSSPLMQKIYSSPYHVIVKRETGLAGIRAGDRILSLGCGAIPFTAIILNQITGCPVSALDIDFAALNKARELLEKAGLKQIRLIAGNGCSIDLSGYSVIITALQVEPKGDIIDNFLSSAKPGARLVMRVPRKTFANSYDPIPSQYKPEKEVSQPMITFGKSVLFRKAG